MLDIIFRFVILVASVALWFAGLRVFLSAKLSRRRKLAWSACLLGTGVVIGVLLSPVQIWEKFTVLLGLLPVLGAVDIFLLRLQRGLSFWIRACGFELGTVFGMAGITRLLGDLAGVSAFLGTH